MPEAEQHGAGQVPRGVAGRRRGGPQARVRLPHLRPHRQQARPHALLRTQDLQRMHP